MIRGSDPHEQTTTPDGRDESGCGVGAEDDTHVGHVFFHRATEGGLRVAGEGVCFVDHDHYITYALSTGAFNRGQEMEKRIRYL